MSSNLRLSWAGDLGSLKTFVEDNLKLQGTWSSPAGEKKVFVTENLKILWLKNKKFLTIEGEDANKIFKHLTGTMCTSNDVDNGNAIENNADNIIIMSIVGIKNVSFEAGIKENHVQNNLSQLLCLVNHP